MNHDIYTKIREDKSKTTWCLSDFLLLNESGATQLLTIFLNYLFCQKPRKNYWRSSFPKWQWHTLQIAISKFYKIFSMSMWEIFREAPKRKARCLFRHCLFWVGCVNAWGVWFVFVSILSSKGHFQYWGMGAKTPAKLVCALLFSN